MSTQYDPGAARLPAPVSNAPAPTLREIPPPELLAPAELLATPGYKDGADSTAVWPEGHTVKKEARETVALVIPAKNEAANISWVLEQVPACIDEIILVDGHSTDATLVTARCSRPGILVVHQEGVGKGDALRAGFQATSADIIVMIDADCSMSPQEIPRFLHFLDNGYDFVKGSRFVAGGGSHDITRLRSFGNHALVYLVNALYEVQLTDLCYGFCAFHRRYLEFLELTASGFEVETQMTLSALRSGLRVAEVPSLEMPRRYGRSNLRTFSDGTRVLRTILRGHRRGISGHAIQATRTLIHGTVRVNQPQGRPQSPSHMTQS